MKCGMLSPAEHSAIKKHGRYGEAVQVNRDGKGSQFDPAMVDVFLEVEGEWKTTSEEVRETWAPESP